MSTSPSAKVERLDPFLVKMTEIETDEMDILAPVAFIGQPIGENGIRYLVDHKCPVCKTALQTIGVGHPTFFCSWCEAKRGTRVEMTREFVCLEDDDER